MSNDDITMDYEPEDGAYPPDEDEVLPQGATFPMAGPPARVPKGGSNKMMVMERQRRALELRKSGATFESIAKALGYADHTGARAAVKKAMERVIQEPAHELKIMTMERLNHMLLPLWGKVQAGDERAIASALSIIDRQVALTGINAATRVEVEADVRSAVLVIQGDKDEYITNLKRMAGVKEEEERKALEERIARHKELAPMLEGHVVEEVMDMDEEDTIPKPKPKPRMKSLTKEPDNEV